MLLRPIKPGSLAGKTASCGRQHRCCPSTFVACGGRSPPPSLPGRPPLSWPQSHALDGQGTRTGGCRLLSRQGGAARGCKGLAPAPTAWQRSVSSHLQLLPLVALLAPRLLLPRVERRRPCHGAVSCQRAGWASAPPHLGPHHCAERVARNIGGDAALVALSEGRRHRDATGPRLALAAARRPRGWLWRRALIGLGTPPHRRRLARPVIAGRRPWDTGRPILLRRLQSLWGHVQVLLLAP